MSFKFLASALVSLTVVTPAGCEQHGCTEIGCGDAFDITLRRADGAPPAYAIEVEHDGERAICPVLSVTASRSASCGARVRLTLADQVVCEEQRTGDSISQHCTPTGLFEAILVVDGAPADVRVTLLEGDAVVGERSFQPSYETEQPNGPGCAPVCRVASERWELP